MDLLSKATLRVVALLIAIALLSGCALLSVDKTMDDAETIAQVGSEVVTKSDYRRYYNYFASLYSMYGLTVPTSGDSKQALMDDVLNMLVDQAVMVGRAKELGYDKLTDEETATLDTQVESTYQSAWDQITQQLTAQGITGADLKTQTQQTIDSQYMTKEQLRAELLNDMMIKKLTEDITKDVTVSDDAAKEAFDKQVADEQLAYAESAASYAQKLLYGQAVVWNPPGVRNVKHILVVYPQDIQDEITAHNASKTSYESQRDTLSADIEAAGDEATQESKDALKAINDSIDETVARLADADARAKAAIEEKVNTVYALAKDGGNFDELVAEYGEDPSMTMEPYKSTGYPIFEGQMMYDRMFADAGLALKAIGDVSEPVYTTFGAHIIRYDSDVPEGPIDIATVSDSLKAELLTAAQDEATKAKLDEWKAKISIKTYLTRADV